MVFDGDVITVEHHEGYTVAWLEPTTWQGRLGFAVGHDEAANDPQQAEAMARAKLVQREESLRGS